MIIISTDAGVLRAQRSDELVKLWALDRFTLEAVVAGLEVTGASIVDLVEDDAPAYTDADIEVESDGFILHVRAEDLALYLQYEVLNFLT